MHEHGRDPANAPWYAQVAGVIDITRIERCLINRRGPVWQFVEQKDCEVGDDQRDIDPWEPTGLNAVRNRNHASSLPGPASSPSHCHTEFTVPPRTPHHVAAAVLANIVRHRGNFSTVIGRPRFGHIWRRIGGSVVTGSAIDVGSLARIGKYRARVYHHGHTSAVGDVLSGMQFGILPSGTSPPTQRLAPRRARPNESAPR